MLVIVHASVVARQEKLIELRAADVMNGKVVNGEQAREFVGRVHFVQHTESGQLVHVWCDRALQYLTQNKVDMSGHVRVVKDSMTLTSNSGVYYGNTKRVESHSDVHLERGTSVLTARDGEYFADEKRAHFWTNVVLVDSATTILCDDLTYFEDRERSIAVGSVKVVQSGSANTVYGDSLEHFDRTHYTIVPKNPRLVKFDTSSTGEIDTFLVVGKLMESYQDSSDRLIATDSVKMARSDLSAQCGKATFYVSRDIIILQSQPVVWQGENQISGDSIVVRLEQKALKTVYVKGKAMAISHADSVRRRRFNQLTGRAMTMSFASSKLRRVDVDRNATSLYYLFDGTSPNGSNRSSGDKILIELDEGKIDRIKVVGGVQGQYHPEKMIDGRESNFNLDGFKWFALRPRQRNLNLSMETYE
jgi:lipopolysaccharide export system protein LptA